MGYRWLIGEGPSRDLGETMVIAHAVVAAERGERIGVLIDDGNGVRVAASEIRRLERLNRHGGRWGPSSWSALSPFSKPPPGANTSLIEEG